MKVLVLTDQFVHLNGTERLSIELSEGLNARTGIRADVASIYTGNVPGAGEAVQKLRERGVLSIYFLGMRPQPSFVSFLLALRRLRRLIRNENYDIIETSVITPTILAAWAAKGLRTKHVAGLHFAFDRARDRGIKNAFLRFSVKYNKHVRFYAVSNFVNQAWVDFSNTPEQFTRTIYNGISDECFEVAPDRESVRQELGIPPTGRIVLFVGRIVKSKGIDIVLKAIGPLLKELGLYIVFVGPGEESVESTALNRESFANEMMEFVFYNGWNDHVIFTGRRGDVSRLMASSDVLVHPTRTEGFGLVLAEAMAAGLPVVSSNIQGIPEVLKKTDSLMTSPNDIKAFQEAVLKVLDRSPAEVARCIQLGRSRASEFRMDKRIDSILQLYADVLAEGKAARHVR